ncbi:MAG: dihydrofolate reductase [Planctomycetales bacterium]
MLSIIVAMDRNRVIGRDGGLPWHISADLKRFKQLTMGQPIIMGRKTYDSIGRPLPGRRSIVISRNRGYAAEGVEVVRNLDEALRLAESAEEVFVIGGSSIYELALSLTDRLCITQVAAEVDGDTFFPEVDFQQWRMTAESAVEKDDKSGLAFQFLTYERL